jgi:hypothetical protein
MIVWLILLGIVLVAVGIVALSGFLSGNVDKKVADTASWTEAEATIQEGRIEHLGKSCWFPVFAFSYAVANEYLSGEFYLQIEGDPAHTLVKKLIGSKFTINYDPIHPNSWYIPEEMMEGAKIGFRGL